MLKIRDLRLTYRSERRVVEALKGVSLTAEHGEFYTLLGPSGCGKTSTLRSIAGFETPTSGAIEIGSTVVYSSAERRVLPPHRRDIGMVFQSYAIWPHMTVFENVAFPLRHSRQRLPAATIRERVLEALRQVQMHSLADRPAPYLSGGQQQRVALARALVREPRVLLLDEPLSNLDAKLRESMRQEIKQLVRRLKITTLYVTHDQLEALSMSDQVAVMHDGEIVQAGTPREVYLTPRNAFVASFMGRTNLLAGRVVGDDAADGLGRVETRCGVLRCALPDWAANGQEVLVGFRPRGVELSQVRPSQTPSCLQGTVRLATFTGDVVEYHIDVEGTSILAEGEPLAPFAEGDQIFVAVPPESCYVLAARPDERGVPVPAGQGPLHGFAAAR